MNTVPILFTFDAPLVRPAGVCIASLLQNAAPDTFYDIFILSNSDMPFAKDFLDRIVKHYGNGAITIRSVNNAFHGAFKIRGIPEAAYYRLLAPILIPEYEKIIYSDVDVIIREDLKRYMDIPLDDYYFAGVDNCLSLQPSVREYVTHKLRLDPSNGYYYSGNLVINSKRLKSDNKVEEFKELAKNKYKFQDMDIINLACNGKIYSLGPSFCVTTYLYQMMVERKLEMEKLYGPLEIEHAMQKGIIHFNGTKPWKGICPNMDIWWTYYRKTPIYDEDFSLRFWTSQRDYLQTMPLGKRFKQLLRYPIDRFVVE